MTEVREYLEASRRFRQMTRAYGPVLIVEDDRCIARLLKHLVMMQGLKAKTVATAEDAITYIEENHGEIRCVILDLHLKDGEGETVVNFIETQHSMVPYVIHTCDWEATKSITKKYPRAAIYKKGESMMLLMEALGFDGSKYCNAG